VDSLFNCKGADTFETKVFRSISHETLCQAFQYWLEQMRISMSEPINIAITQSLRDDGIDILLEFSKSEVKVGIQVKSCNDVDEKDFTSKCIAQISRSHKHSISRLLIAIGADLTDAGHQQKVRGLTAEISEMDDNFCKVFSPEKTLTIWRTFDKKEHPIGQIGSYGDAFKLISALEKNFSNDPYYKTNIVWKTTLKKENIPKGQKGQLEFRISAKQRPNSKNLMDAFRESHITGNSIIIPAEDIQKFQVRKNGKILEKNKKVSSITLTPVKRKLSLTLETIESKTGNVLAFENLIFIVDSIVGKTIHISTHENNSPYSFKFSIENEQLVSNFSAGVDGSANVVQRYKLVRFVAALIESNSFYLKDSTGNIVISGSPRQFLKMMSKEDIETLAQLSYIQEKIGDEIFLPNNLTYEDLKDIFFAYKLLSSGNIEVSSIEFSSTLNKAQATEFVRIFKKEKGLKNSVLDNFPIEIELFGKKTLIGLGSYQIPFVILSDGLEKVERQIEHLADTDSIAVKFRNSADCTATIKLYRE
jgi:hypothetical protein